MFLHIRKSKFLSFCSVNVFKNIHVYVYFSDIMNNLLESTKPEIFRNTIYVRTESLVYEYLNTHTEKEFYLHRYLHVY